MSDALLGTIFILGGVLSDVTANIFLKKSVGFKYISSQFQVSHNAWGA